MMTGPENQHRHERIDGIADHRHPEDYKHVVGGGQQGREGERATVHRQQHQNQRRDYGQVGHKHAHQLHQSGAELLELSPFLLGQGLLMLAADNENLEASPLLAGGATKVQAEHNGQVEYRPGQDQDLDVLANGRRELFGEQQQTLLPIKSIEKGDDKTTADDHAHYNQSR